MGSLQSFAALWSVIDLDGVIRLTITAMTETRRIDAENMCGSGSAVEDERVAVYRVKTGRGRGEKDETRRLGRVEKIYGSAVPWVDNRGAAVSHSPKVTPTGSWLPPPTPLAVNNMFQKKKKIGVGRENRIPVEYLDR